LDVLLTFTGFHDPYAVGLVGQEEQPGPILSLVGARAFDQVILFSTPNAEKNTTATEKALRAWGPAGSVEELRTERDRAARRLNELTRGFGQWI
jgi:hypothetical protein